MRLPLFFQTEKITISICTVNTWKCLDKDESLLINSRAAWRQTVSTDLQHIAALICGGYQPTPGSDRVKLLT